jgi:hypothetical protein
MFLKNCRDQVCTVRYAGTPRPLKLIHINQINSPLSPRNEIKKKAMGHLWVQIKTKIKPKIDKIASRQHCLCVPLRRNALPGLVLSVCVSNECDCHW